MVDAYYACNTIYNIMLKHWLVYCLQCLLHQALVSLIQGIEEQTEMRHEVPLLYI